MVSGDGAAGARAAIERLGELAALRKGWLDGAGEPVTPEALRVARSLLASRPGLAGMGLGLFPTETGGVSMEFGGGGWDLTVEVLPSGVLEVYGIERGGPGELPPRRFGGDGPAFRDEVDRRVGLSGLDRPGPGPALG